MDNFSEADSVTIATIEEGVPANFEARELV